MNEEMATLKSEAVLRAADAAPVAAAVDVGPSRADALRPMVAGALVPLGAAVCRRYHVTMISGEECHALAGAMLGVAEAYGMLDKADPRVMAWLTLGGTAAAIVANRQPVPPPVVEETAVAEPA